MAQHIDTLRALFDAFNRRDFNDALRYAHPEIELHPGITELDVARQYRGHEEVRRFFETITDAWESYVVEPEETIDAPGDRVLVIERWRARGREGIALAFELTDVYTFRDGLIVRIDGYRDAAEALEAMAGPRTG